MEPDPTASGDEPLAVRTSGVDLDVVEYLVVSLPDLTRVPDIAAALRSLVVADEIAILDLVVVSTSIDGVATTTEPDDVPGLSALVDGSEVPRRLLSDDDVAMVGAALPAGATALVVVVEDRWAHALTQAARAAGGRVVGGERIPHRRIADSLAASGALLAASQEPEDGHAT
ncbi:DUF6325 family protein [Cellulomonas massiliensis]|uniref:DUF6325 family protein n=1 Tax=Cellulomonas massiliensis TaxID=1465811 RepID=UPI0002EB9A87|nr:DUF6325 family protein [Cellulomonas massiliensis]